MRPSDQKAALPEQDRPVGACLQAEVSASALRANLATLRAMVGRGTKLCPVVKADCYGLGLAACLRVIAEAADWLAVATPQEALELRSLGYAGPILAFFSPSATVREPPGRDVLEELTTRRVTLTVASPDDVEPIARAAATQGAAEVHVKIDTGMCRSGVRAEEAAGLIGRLRDRRGIRLTGLYTHFACADEADLAPTRRQLRAFRQAAGPGAGTGVILHAANSAAIARLPEAHLDMVRPGIAVYGYQPSEDLLKPLPLRPALRLWAPLMQVKAVRPGERCGYGLTYAFDRPGRIGLVPVGYADGYFRGFSNRATMRLRGRDVPVRGRVSMDQTIIDLTDLPEASVGEEVEIISPDPHAPHSVENLSRLAGTIPYELISRLGRRARRVLVE